jgi:hypothetical protein
MTISIKPTASGSTIEQDGSAILTVDGSGNISTPNTFTSTGAITGTGGIYLGGTASANLLDDYEEGTWTPVITDGTNNVSTYYYQLGKYVKVGDMVFITVYTSINNKGSISGNLKVTGLPFTTNPGTNQNRFIMPIYCFNNTTRKYDFAQVNQNSTEFELRGINSAGNGTVGITGANVAAGSQMSANFHYRTT